MGLYRWVLQLVIALAGLLSGCFWHENGSARTLYGIDPPPHDPSVQLIDFSYTPLSPVHPGDTLTFTVTANKPTARGEGFVTARLGWPGQPVAGIGDGYILIGCNDNGVSPDAVSGDGVFTGNTTLPESIPAQTDIPVRAQLHWNDYKPSYDLNGEPLDIEEAE